MPVDPSDNDKTQTHIVLTKGTKVSHCQTLEITVREIDLRNQRELPTVDIDSITG